jgi:hypothetical protein
LFRIEYRFQPSVRQKVLSGAGGIVKPLALHHLAYWRGSHPKYEIPDAETVISADTSLMGNSSPTLKIPMVSVIEQGRLMRS